MGKNKEAKKAAAAASASSSPRKSSGPAMYHVAAPIFVVVCAVCVYLWNGAQGEKAPSAPIMRTEKEVAKAEARAEPDVLETVRDNHTECVTWAAAEECDNNPVFMLDQCAAACAKKAAGKLRGGPSLPPAAADAGALPDGWAEYKDPATGKAYYSDGKASQWERPTAAGGSSAEAADASSGGALPAGWQEYKDPATGRAYYSDGTASTWERPTKPAGSGSANARAAAVAGGGATPQHIEDSWHTPSDCVAWAGSGQCEANPGFMLYSCEASCHKLGVTRAAYAARCKRPDDATPALTPGSMPLTFERIMSAEFAHLQPEMISQDPPVVLFHNFLEGDEADAFISHGKGKYTESKGVGVDKNGRMTDVKTEIRTSSHTWCQEKGCLDDPVVQRVMQRVSDVTQTPQVNGEFAQLVYYHACPDEKDSSCAFYRRHSDYIDGDAHRNQGVRIYTLFMYLNDVPEGGGTRFTDLPGGPITFQPQRGKAILWPSVYADRPDTQDPRTHHEALPVTKGEKFGANFWIHQYDFKGPHAIGCTMD